MPHLKPTHFDAWKLLALCRQQVFPAQRDSSSTAAPADACEPIHLAGKNDPVAGTTLVATICNDFVRRLPGAHALWIIMIVCITFNSSLVPLIDGVWISNPLEFEFSGFRRNRTDDLGIHSPSLWPTEPRLHVRLQGVVLVGFCGV